MKNKKQQDNKKKKKSNPLISLIKWFFDVLFFVLMFPIRIIKQVFIVLIKRLKFSISFKISASYFVLYVLIILIVTLTSSIGFFTFVLNNFKENTITKNLSYISDNINSDENLDKLLNNEKIKEISIYDSHLNTIYTTNDNNKKYINNYIVTFEEIIYNSTYLSSSEQIIENSTYYINIYYNIEDLILQTSYIVILIFVSGIFGLLIFIPIVSRTSNKVIKPIKKMTEIAKTISVNNINTRLDPKDMQDELQELSHTFNDMMDRIEEGYKSQQQFVSDASHELRTPIAVIKGYANMLDRWGKNDKNVLEESIQAIKNESDNMQDLIEKLLFIARNDKQTLKYNKVDFNISEILLEIEKESTMIDTNHKYKFEFVNDAHIYADKKRIKQAIRIFIENAVKFTPKGGNISIYGYKEEGMYAISIVDDGIGIDKKDLPKIFDRLYRAEESRNREIGGHGLGLSIAKIIILGHKGKIKVRSKLGTGSEFIIYLPIL